MVWNSFHTPTVTTTCCVFNSSADKALGRVSLVISYGNGNQTHWGRIVVDWEECGCWSHHKPVSHDTSWQFDTVIIVYGVEAVVVLGQFTSSDMSSQSGKSSHTQSLLIHLWDWSVHLNSESESQLQSDSSACDPPWQSSTPSHFCKTHSQTSVNKWSISNQGICIPIILYLCAYMNIKILSQPIIILYDMELRSI